MSTGTETGQRRRRRVRLTPVRPIPVEFTGERAGEGPLTLGQLDVYAWAERDARTTSTRSCASSSRCRRWCRSMTWPRRSRC